LLPIHVFQEVNLFLNGILTSVKEVTVSPYLYENCLSREQCTSPGVWRSRRLRELEEKMFSQFFTYILGGMGVTRRSRSTELSAVQFQAFPWGVL
jgi:hypothetical protein